MFNQPELQAPISVPFTNDDDYNLNLFQWIFCNTGSWDPDEVTPPMDGQMVSALLYAYYPVYMEADTYNCGSHETDCTEGDKKFVSLGNVASVFRALNKIVARRRDAKSHDGFIKVLRPEAIPQLLKHRQFIELKALVRDVLNLDMVVMPVDGGCTVEFRKI